MGYLTEDIARSLKAARESKRLSQRALSKKVGLTQSHISKIENSAVDPQLSNLIELSRALGLEVMLVPQKLVPAVQSLVRSTASVYQEVQKANQVKNELNQIQSVVARLQQAHPKIEEFPRIRNVLKDLQSMRAVSNELKRISSIGKELKNFQEGFKENTEALSQIRSYAEELQQLRNTLAHNALRARSDVSKVLPAYSLDEDDDHG